MVYNNNKIKVVDDNKQSKEFSNEIRIKIRGDND